MNQPSLSQQVLCRPAREVDRADVTEFCKGIWEGGDYVPEVWDQWFNDPNGILAVAEFNGHAIGCSKVSQLADGQWWLEGFRVDPQCQGMKVGSHLHRYVVDWWLENGDGILRLMTDGQNYPIHHLCGKTGFQKTGEVCGYRAAALAETVDRFTPATSLQTAAAFAVESESIQTTNGLSDFGWRICRPEEEVFKNHSSENADYFHSFYWWKEQQGLFSAWEDEEEERRTLVLGVLACALDDMPELLMDVRRFAAERKLDSVFQIAFDLPQITSPLLEAGFDKRWKRSNAFLFEKTHSSKT
jgi:GNAT superfamily N-acetyltransferase